MIDPQAKALASCARLRVTALLACTTLVAAGGCAESVAQTRAPDAGAPPGEGSMAGAGSGAVSTRCGLSPDEPENCGDAGGAFGYYASQLGPDPPYTCVAIEPDYCSASPLPFATLTECLTQCEQEAELTTTLCQERGEGEPACEASAGADRARLEAETPFGALHLTRAWLDRFRGFTNGVTIHFTDQVEARFDARPSLTITLHDFGTVPHLIGEHDLHATLNLCDREVDMRVRMTVTVDELTSGASGRFEATFESLAPDIQLDAEVTFSQVCRFSTSV
jgi:hypothetical protein